jgi:hypothetical protein
MLNVPKYKGPIGECVSGCRNPDKPQYALGTFPPKAKPQGGFGGGESSKHLASIAVSLAEIASILRLSRDPLEKIAKDSF